MARAPRVKRTFHQELVLNRWMLSHFKGGSLPALKERLGEDRHEGIDDDGQTRFFHELTRNLFDMDRISEAELRRYDLNIVRHWQAITHRRNAADGVILTLKYFQYLSLLFSEIYLDWYFKRSQQLLDGLNEQMAAYRLEPGAENFRDYTAEDLNKLAFWNATGSGKTLLLHVNIHQYLHYFQNGRTNVWPDRIILLTPNEGLSRQHLEEFRLSGINAHLFDKNQSDSLYKGWIDVIEVTKLAEEMGDKTVATGAFEGNNLVLVDEGHRGAGTAGGVWMARRAALVRGGFAFEYSATFSQSVAKGATVEKAEQDILKVKAKRQFDTAYARLDASQQAQIALTSADRDRARIEGVREAYAKAVLIDYSYKYFYADGYGKESLILNLDDAGYDKHGALYFTACLLSFYQQLWLWDTHRDRIAEFNIEKPLWVFVGNTVSGEDGDVLAVLKFLASFLNDDAQAIEWIADLIADKARLLDPNRRDVFAGRFAPLMQRDAETIYADILRRLFNAEARQRLKLVNLKGSKGELALRVGNAPHFGVINIGDDAGFFKTAEDVEAFDTETDDFGGGLFGTINLEGSKLNVLIGSRKFTEGWSSWRVSTMGLLNMGQGEGSQIIQLFGRGVRLKGKGMSLKRSLPHERPKGVHLERLETLNIFGVRANYMAAFKDYLKEEGITPSDEIIALDFPTGSNLPAGKRLKTLKLKDGYKDNQIKGFKRTHFPWLYEVPADFVGKIKLPHATLDLYPRIEALSTKDNPTSKVAPDARHKGKLDRAAMAMFDWDAVFLALQEYKLLKAWSNLRLDRQRLVDFCTHSETWYTLFIPQAELAINGFADVTKQQTILIQLLTEYTDRFYQALKAGYEGQFYDVAYITDDHGSMLKLYQFEIDGTDDGREYENKLKVLKDLVAAGKIGEASQWNAPHMVAISFARHLYYPLIAPDVTGNLPLKMRPLAFDSPSEVQFVRDLESFYNSPAAKELLAGRSLYLLRNADTQAKGLGFARAGNFYPDFLLWLVDDETGQQWLSFVDPKGIRNLDLNDPKLGLHSEIKQLEKKLDDPGLILNAFILSFTPHDDLLNIGTAGSRAELEDRHVLFMDEGRDSYLTKLIARITTSPTKAAPRHFILPQLHELAPFSAIKEIAEEFGVTFTLYGGAASRCAMFLYYQTDRAFDLFDLTPFTSDIDLAHSGSKEQTAAIRSAISDRITFATWCRWSIIDADTWKIVTENVAGGVQVPLRQIVLRSDGPQVPSREVISDLESRSVSWGRSPGFDNTSYALLGRTMEIFGLMMAINVVTDMEEIAGKGTLVRLESALEWLESDAQEIQDRGRLRSIEGDDAPENRLRHRAFQIWANRHARGRTERIDQALRFWMEAARILPIHLSGIGSGSVRRALTITKLTGSGRSRARQNGIDYRVNSRAREMLDDRLGRLAELLGLNNPTVVDPVYDVVAYFRKITITTSSVEEAIANATVEHESDVYGSLPNGEFLHLAWAMPRNSRVVGLTGFILPHHDNSAEVERMEQLPAPFAVGGSFDGQFCWLRIDVEAIALQQSGGRRDIEVDVVALSPRQEYGRVEVSVQQAQPPNLLEVDETQFARGEAIV